MIGKIAGALIGRELTRRSGDGAKGAIAGAASVAILRRLGPLGLVLGGAYAARQAFKRRQDGRTTTRG